jgi:ketosteroid isomerase-like protein
VHRVYVPRLRRHQIENRLLALVKLDPPAEGPRGSPDQVGAEIRALLRHQPPHGAHFLPAQAAGRRSLGWCIGYLDLPSMPDARRDTARAMSRENVEIIRRGYAHFIATGDFLVEDVDPDFVWDMSTFRGWPERQTYVGIEGAREFMTSWLEAWEDWQIEVEELVDAGERVVAIVRQRGRSKTTGLPVDMRFAMVWTLRNGKQMRMQMYADSEEALEAAGLRE